MSLTTLDYSTNSVSIVPTGPGLFDVFGGVAFMEAIESGQRWIAVPSSCEAIVGSNLRFGGHRFVVTHRLEGCGFLCPIGSAVLSFEADD